MDKALNNNGQRAVEKVAMPSLRAGLGGSVGGHLL